MSKGIPTSESGTPHRVCSSKRRLPGGVVSVPANPSLNEVNIEIVAMIESGRFNLGMQCAPYQMTQYIHLNGKLTTKEITIYRRKIPLVDLRKKLLEKHSLYMRLASDEDISKKSLEELKEELRKGGQSELELQNETHSNVCTELARKQRTRHLVMWHDHATILGKSNLLITVHTIYDPAVFLTDSEYEEKYKTDSVSNQ